MTPNELIQLLGPWASTVFSGGTLVVGFKLWGAANRAIGQNKAEHKSFQTQLTDNKFEINKAHDRIDTHLENL